MIKIVYQFLVLCIDSCVLNLNLNNIKNLPYLIIISVFSLQFGFAQAQTDEEPGQHSITTLDDCNVIWRPTDWDVDFNLHAPNNTTIEGILKNGEITRLKVTPEERKKEIVNR